MKSTAVIFDMDGVIADTNPFHLLAFKEFFDRHQVYYSNDQFIEHMYGKHNSYIMSHFFDRKIQGDELIAFENEKELLFREIYKEHVAALPGFLDFFETLKRQNIAVGVATSAPKDNLLMILGELDILKDMDSVLASEDVIKYKPHPEIYLKSFENVQKQPESCFVFEDSHSGASAGLAAGAMVIGVLSSHTPEELPNCHDFILDFKEMDLERLESLTNLQA